MNNDPISVQKRKLDVYQEAEHRMRKFERFQLVCSLVMAGCTITAIILMAFGVLKF